MVDPAFSIPAAGYSHVQVTATGEWETASRLASGGDAEAYLFGFGDDQPPALGIELFWEGPPISFVGARLDGDRVSELPELVEALTTPTLSSHRALATLSGGELGVVAVAACGAINAWLSVGEANLWDGATWHEPSSLLNERSDLRTCAHPVGLEVGHAHAWYAVEVSRRGKQGHVVDLPLLDRLAGLVKNQIQRSIP